MGETLTGTDGMSLETMALIAGAIVVCLALIFWFVRRRGHMIFMRGGGNRQPRLAVLDAAAVDSRRRLVLVRRDHVEHLILIGGPSDIVVESGIGRSAAAQAKQAAKVAAKAAAKANQEKRPASEPATPPQKPAPVAATEPAKPAAKPAAEAKPADSVSTAAGKAEAGAGSLPGASEAPKRPEPARPEPAKPASAVAATSAAGAAAAVSAQGTDGNGGQAPVEQTSTAAKVAAAEPDRPETVGDAPQQSAAMKSEFEDALEAARDLVMPDTGDGADDKSAAPEQSASPARTVPAPEPIDPVPAPPPPPEPAVASTEPEQAKTGPIAAAADELIADFDRVLEAEMSNTDEKKVVEFEPPQTQPPAKAKQPTESHDVASLEDEMKKLLGDLSVKQ